VLPITSSVANPAAAAAGESDAAQRAKTDPDAAAAQFEGMLFASALGPLSKDLGVLGDVLTDAVGTAVARGQHDQFYHYLQALVDASKTEGMGST
jgi:hypothetical protein